MTDSLVSHNRLDPTDRNPMTVELLTTAQVAEVLNVVPRTINAWLWRSRSEKTGEHPFLEKNPFPEPDQRLGKIMLWRKSTVVRWEKRTQRETGKHATRKNKPEVTT